MPRSEAFQRRVGTAHHGSGGQCPPYRRPYAGNRTVTLVPLPNSLITLTVPPCISTKDRTMLSPSPSPRRLYSKCPDECLLTSNPVKNRSPSLGRFAASIPTPVSLTTISTSPSSPLLADSAMIPSSGVNLIAFGTR